MKPGVHFLMCHMNPRSKPFGPRVRSIDDDSVLVLERSILKEADHEVLLASKRAWSWVGWTPRQACLCSSSSLQFVSFVESRPMAEIVVDYFWFGRHYRGPDTRPFPGVCEFGFKRTRTVPR